MNFSIKYRPKSLDEVVGHDKTIKELKKRAEKNDYPYVMLFSGITGIGKTTLQKICAKNILCNNKDEHGNACNECEICKNIMNETPCNYFYEFNGSNTNIEEMRIIEELAITKQLSKSTKKVIIIDELQELSSNKKAQKSILKLLEKPIKNTYFILGTMEESKVDKAIVNRTVKYRLNPLKANEIGQYLISVCGKEGIDLKDPERVQVLVSLAQNSEGSLRTAVALLERVIYSDIWTTTDVVKELGVVSKDRMISIINGVLNGDSSVVNNNDIDKDFYDKIEMAFLTYYKYLSGVHPDPYYLDQIDGIGKFPIERVELVINEMNEIMKYTYNNKLLTDFILLKVINLCKKDKEKNVAVPASSEPAVRRRVAP